MKTIEDSDRYKEIVETYSLYDKLLQEQGNNGSLVLKKSQIKHFRVKKGSTSDQLITSLLQKRDKNPSLNQVVSKKKSSHILNQAKAAGWYDEKRKKSASLIALEK